ncbi:MAG: response regulator [Candidatus Saccharibacteria bacterium]|nr:response regulator [Pseudorhodobacter sp.]
MPISQTVELPDLPRGPLPEVGRDVTAAPLPLRGITVLAVEDSRFASEALRLMCRRLGARLRRAESLHDARAHLRLYRPNVVIVDLGLPDGRGEALIRDIVQNGPAGPVVLGTSADPTGRPFALAAGARGFLDKPLESFAAFHAILIRHLPDHVTQADLPQSDMPVIPDTLALRDDFARAAAMNEAGIASGTEAETQTYLSGFLTGIARHARDAALAEAAQHAGTSTLSTRFDQLRHMLAGRLASPTTAFGEGHPPTV